MTPCNLVEIYRVSNESIASVFQVNRVEPYCKFPLVYMAPHPRRQY